MGAPRLLVYGGIHFLKLENLLEKKFSIITIILDAIVMTILHIF